MRAPGRLGAVRGAAVQTADGHVSVPVFFFFPPLLPPLSTEQHFPTLLPLLFLLRGRVEGRGGGAGREDAGAGRLGATPPGRPRPRPALLPRPPGPPRARGADPPSQLRAPAPRRSCGRSSNSGAERTQGAPRHPPARPRLTVCRGLLPWPRAGGVGGSLGKGTPGRSESQRSGRGGMLVPGPGAPFLPEAGAGISTRDCGPPRPERDPPTGAPEGPFPAAAPQGSPGLRSAWPPRPRFRNGNRECGNGSCH